MIRVLAAVEKNIKNVVDGNVKSCMDLDTPESRRI